MTLEEVFVRCADRLYALALRITGVSEEAEAAIAQVLSLAPPTNRASAGASALERWLFLRVAKAAYARHRMRRRDVRPIVVDDVVPALDGQGGHFNAIEDWSAQTNGQELPRGQHQALSAAIDALPPDSRAALVLNDVERVAASDIAEILGLDVPAVKLHVHRARLFVRQRMSAHFAGARAVAS